MCRELRVFCAIFLVKNSRLCYLLRFFHLWLRQVKTVARSYCVWSIIKAFKYSHGNTYYINTLFWELEMYCLFVCCVSCVRCLICVDNVVAI